MGEIYVAGKPGKVGGTKKIESEAAEAVPDQIESGETAANL